MFPQHLTKTHII